MKRCGNCGHELKMRSFRALDNICPHCGELRYSKTTRARLIKFRHILYALVVCVSLDITFPDLDAFSFIGCPLAIVIWLYYHPFKNSESQDQPDKIGDRNT